MRKGANGARQLADGNDFARAAKTNHISSELAVPQRQFETEGHRLGMDSVGTTDHRRASMLERPRVYGLHQPIEVGQKQIARLPHLERLRRVDDVGRRETEMQPARRWADVLRNSRR